jgi:HK97 family phage major capsid protein
MPKSAQALVEEYQAIYARVDREGRRPTQAENARVQDLLEQALEQKAIEGLAREIGAPTSSGWLQNGSSTGGGPGDLFIRSDGYKAVRSPDSRPQQWTTGPVEVGSMGPPLMLKGTLLETTTGGPGGALTPPDYTAGIQQILFRPLSVADLLATDQTTGSQLRYVVEGTATSAAAGVAEGGVKPESTLGLSETVEPVKKIATVLPISDELLEDAPNVQAYINGRLSLFVRIEEERQLLYGTSGGNEVTGILTRSGVQNHNATGGTAIAEIREMITKSRTSFLEPDGLLIHPNQWESIELYRSTTGEFQVDPFKAGPRTLWGLPVVVTNTIGAGTVLLGSFRQGARLYRRGGVSLEATNSHSDWFVRDITAIRAEQREALAVYRPASFVRGTAFA